MTEAMDRTVELSPSLRALIDERLDGIERALRTANMPRGERLRIVEDVERQLLDMLAEVNEHPTRRDVLQALAKLDPPEAYLADQPQAARTQPESLEEAPEPTAKPAAVAPTATPIFAGYSRWALGSMAALLLTGFFFICAFFGVVANSGSLFGTGVFLAFCSALTALGLGVTALYDFRRDPKRGIGYACSAIIISSWLLMLCLCYLVAAMFHSEGAAFALLLLKDIPFVAVLIWCLTKMLKNGSANKAQPTVA